MYRRSEAAWVQAPAQGAERVNSFQGMHVSRQDRPHRPHRIAVTARFSIDHAAVSCPRRSNEAVPRRAAVAELSRVSNWPTGLTVTRTWNSFSPFGHAAATRERCKPRSTSSRYRSRRTCPWPHVASPTGLSGCGHTLRCESGVAATDHADISESHRRVVSHSGTDLTAAENGGSIWPVERVRPALTPPNTCDHAHGSDEEPEASQTQPP